MGDQVVTPLVNGHPLQELPLATGFASYRLVLPERFLVEGRNRLTLRYRYAVSPRELGQGADWRRLAVAVDWLRFENGDNPPPPRTTMDGSALDLPVRSAVFYHHYHREGLRIEADSVTAPDGNGGRIRCVAVSQSGVMSLIAETGVGNGPLRARVMGPEGEPFRLELRSIGGKDPEKQWSVVRLVSPRLTVPSGQTGSTAEDRSFRQSSVRQRPNVVIYLVDALRVDRLGVYGQRRGLSPN